MFGPNYSNIFLNTDLFADLWLITVIFHWLRGKGRKSMRWLIYFVKNGLMSQNMKTESEFWQNLQTGQINSQFDIIDNYVSL